MRRITLFLFAALVVTSVDAASYQKTDGTIVDPILDISGNPLPYAGSGLEPNVNLDDVDLAGAFLSQANLVECSGVYVDLTGAYLTSANLSVATLTNADLSHANLTSADLPHASLYRANLTGTDLIDADLTGADLTGAYLTGADLAHANLTDADLYGTLLTRADLSGAIFTNTQYYTDATWTDAFYYVGDEPTWASGMDAAWRTSVGIVERSSLGEGSPVPEPSTLLLALLGLALVPRRRRR